MTPKALVIAMASILMACGAAVIGSYIARFGPVKLGYHGVRFALTIALSISLIRGWIPGRWISVVLICSGLFSLVYVGESLVSEGCSGSGLIVLGVIHAGCVIGLITPFAGRHFKRTSTVEPATDGNHH